MCTSQIEDLNQIKMNEKSIQMNANKSNLIQFLVLLQLFLCLKPIWSEESLLIDILKSCMPNKFYGKRDQKANTIKVI